MFKTKLHIQEEWFEPMKLQNKIIESLHHCCNFNYLIIYRMFKPYYSMNGWDKLISYNKLANVEQFLRSKYQKIEYIGHGGSCVSFSDGSDEIIKVCIRKGFMTKNSKKFIEFSNFLLNHKIKILPPKSIIYEDKYFFIYTQDSCVPVYKINHLSMVKILKIIVKLIKNKIKIADLFYKNFGIKDGDIYIYDYHDYGFFYSDDIYYITHLAHIFNLHINDTFFQDLTINTKILKNMEFGKGLLPDNVVNILANLYNFKYDQAVKEIKLYIKETKNKVTKSYANYQYIDISNTGFITLKSHTLEKLNIFMKLSHLLPNNFTLIDYGCSLGGIGNKIAQMYPKAKITLNNITKNELEVCREVASNQLLTNVTVTSHNLTDDNSSYDVTLYFAILHHILKNYTFDQVMEMVYRQTKKYSVIELPFYQDALLRNVIGYSTSVYEKSFKYLENIEIFEKTIQDKFDIMYSTKVEYGSKDLDRYAYVLIKKN